MKKFSKIILASGIVLGFSVTPELFNATEAQAQKSIEPYYNYDGYTAYQSGFILDKNFKESLKYDNFTINGYQISKNTTGDNRINLYDQTLYGVSENKANGVFFSLDGKSINKNTLIMVNQILTLLLQHGVKNICTKLVIKMSDFIFIMAMWINVKLLVNKTF